MARVSYYKYRKHKTESILTQSGTVVRINKYEEFNNFVKAYSHTAFAQHYSLFRDQIGVYRFNWFDKVLYVGYSENLEARVMTSFFNHCLTLKNITFQYILCDNKDEAMQVEAFYIKELQPNRNVTGKKKPTVSITMELIKENFQFCAPMHIFFDEYFNR